MERNYIKIAVSSLLISVIGVFVIDYFSHLLFSKPMETIPYFLVKFILYFVFSIIFLRILNLDKKEFIKVVLGGIAVSLLFGIYYNILPAAFDFYPLGISLEGLTFLGMGLFGTGLAFGIVHTSAFVGGYYSSKFIFYFLKNPNIFIRK